MGRHALLSASSSKRWMNCTPSAILETSLKEEESIYAKEGSAAHALAEHYLKKYLKMRSRKPKSEFDSDEMDQYISEYVSFVTEQMEQTRLICKSPIFLVEQHLDYSSYVPDGFGTGDVVIVADRKLSVIDLKYGKGIAISAEWNSQMMLYSLGALQMFEMLYDIDTVEMTIYQPRLEAISTWEISAEELQNWAEHELKPRARLATAGEGEYSSGEWCRFCKARFKCRERAKDFLQLAKMEFREPPLLNDEEITEVLGKADQLKRWTEEVYTYAQNEAIQNQKEWPGFKLVEGRANRKYTDEDAVANVAKTAGFTDIYKQSLISITEMEHLMGKKQFVEILGDFVYKPKGKITLVTNADKREAIYPPSATTEFKEEN